MSSININKPIIIAMEVVEIDNYLPSIKMKVDVKILHPTGSLSYEANDIWFECSEWDKFVVDMSNISTKNSNGALLGNMSNSFLIKIDSLKAGLNFSIKSTEKNINEGFADIYFSSVIDEDLLGYLKKQFLSFEKWW